MTRFLLAAISFILAVAALFTTCAYAAELRILDASGLIRGVRVVKDSSVVRIDIIEPAGVRGECVATNLDGIASERRVPISSKGECVFEALAAGSWQIAISGGARWRVRIEG